MPEKDIATSPESEVALSMSLFASGDAHEFTRYFVASLVALIADGGTLWLGTSVLGIPYLVSGAISFLLGLCVAYALSVWWVFERRVMRDRRGEFAAFCIIGIAGLGLNELLLWFLTSFFGLYYLVSKLGSALAVFLWNFFARKLLLFR